MGDVTADSTTAGVETGVASTTGAVTTAAAVVFGTRGLRAFVVPFPDQAAAVLATLALELVDDCFGIL